MTHNLTASTTLAMTVTDHRVRATEGSSSMAVQSGVVGTKRRPVSTSMGMNALVARQIVYRRGVSIEMTVNSLTPNLVDPPVTLLAIDHVELG